MKTRIVLIVTIILLSFTSTFAQNKVMAKAFYKKAQKSYSEKHYKNVILLLEKTKEHLGSTNPDITYLEIKARFSNNLKGAETKKLIQQFLKDVPNDSRVDEIAGILADIEILGNNNKTDTGTITKNTIVAKI